MVLKKTYSMILLLFSVQDRTKAAAATAKLLQSCPTLRPHRRQPNRLPRHWDSPGKNTGVGCHFLLQCMKAKRENEVAQSVYYRGTVQKRFDTDTS